MESKYLVFDKYTIPGRKTPVYEVKNKNSLESLGAIYFYPVWRKYVFESNPEIIYDINCLTDISTFIQEIQAEWKASLKNEK